MTSKQELLKQLESLEEIYNTSNNHIKEQYKILIDNKRNEYFNAITNQQSNPYNIGLSDYGIYRDYPISTISGSIDMLGLTISSAGIVIR
jgi:hypothetical protein